MHETTGVTQDGTGLEVGVGVVLDPQPEIDANEVLQTSVPS